MIEFKPVEILNETELAWLVELNGNSYWVPKSKCQIEDGVLHIPEWLAYEKEMI